jgi:uncharacterized membrane protein
MANFRDINGASRQMNRVTDIELESHNRSALESVMVAMAATGRVQEMAVIAQTLEKTSREMQLADTLETLNKTIRGLKQSTISDSDTVTLSKSEYEALLGNRG